MSKFVPVNDPRAAVAWEFKDPTLEQLLQARKLADELSDAAFGAMSFGEDVALARKHALSIVRLLWPPTTT